MIDSNQTINISSSGINASLSLFGANSDNISNVNTPGFKALVGTTTTGNNGYGAVPVISQTLNVQGNIKTTNEKMNLALEGEGMFAVSPASIGPNGTTIDSDVQLFVRSGVFDKTSDSYIGLFNEFVLLGFLSNSNGSFDTTLKPIIINEYAVIDAKPTSEIAVEALILNSAREVDDENTSILFALDAEKSSFGDGNEISILHDKDNGSCLGGTIVYSFSQMASNSNNIPTSVSSTISMTYGGFVLSNPVVKDSIVDKNADDSAQERITIQINGGIKQEITIKYSKTTTVEDFFDSINTAITSNTEINAAFTTSTKGIGTNNIQAAIGSKNPMQQFMIEFESANIATALGFKQVESIAGATPGIARFNSLYTLNTQLATLQGVNDSSISEDGQFMSFTTGPGRSNVQFYVNPKNPNSTQSESLMNALGLSQNVDAETQFISPIYNPSNPMQNMTQNGLGLEPQVTNNIDVYDSLGQERTLITKILKMDNDQYIITAYADPGAIGKTAIQNTSNMQVYASSMLTFDSQGNIASISPINQIISSSGSQTISDPYKVIAGDFKLAINSDEKIFEDSSLASLIQQINSANLGVEASMSFINNNYGIAISGLNPNTKISASGPMASLLGVATSSQQYPSLTETFQINWMPPNDANPSYIKFINLNNAKNTQTHNNTIKIIRNGYPSGVYSDFNIAPDGIISIKFTNDITLPIAQIPVATFASINNLVPSLYGGNTYHQTIFSGSVVFTTASNNGNVQIISGALEQINTSMNAQLIDVSSDVQSVMSNTSVASSYNKATEFVIQQLS